MPEFTIKRSLKWFLLLFLLIILTRCGGGSDNTPTPLGTPELPDERTLGYDWLGLQHPHFRLPQALEELPDRTPLAIGSLDFTFGADMEPVGQLLKSGKVQHYRVHFWNGPSVRKRNAGSYEPYFGMSVGQLNKALILGDQRLLAAFQERVRLYCGYFKAHPTIRFYFSWMLEHNLSLAAWVVLDKAGRDACPWNGYYVVNNPVDTHKFPNVPREGVLYEAHGTEDIGIAHISSLDGLDIASVNRVNWLQNSVTNGVTLAWGLKYNCLAEGQFIDPRNRLTCPKRRDHRRIVKLSLENEALVHWHKRGFIQRGGIVYNLIKRRYHAAYKQREENQGVYGKTVRRKEG